MPTLPPLKNSKKNKRKRKNSPRWRELVARAYDIKSLGNVGNVSDVLLKF